jgi:hypothetical protein
LGDRVYAAVGRVRDGHAIVCPQWVNRFAFPSWGPFGLEVNYLIAHLILLPVTLWLADVVTKLFDEPSVKFAQWFYRTVQESRDMFDPKPRTDVQGKKGTWQKS